MKNLTKYFLALTAVSSMSLSAAFGGAVITGAKSSLGAGDVKDSFMGNKSTAKPCGSSSATDSFLSKALGGAMNAKKFEETWTKIGFRTGNKFESVSSDDKAADFVKNNDGGICFVEKAPTDAGVKVIQNY